MFPITCCLLFFQVRLPEIKHLVKSTIMAKSSYNLHWSSEATKRLLVLFATTLCLLLARLQIMGSQLPVFTRFDNPASVAPTPVRQLTYHYLISVNLWLLLFPCNLCCDWTMGTVPLVESFADPRNVATLAVYALFAALTASAYATDNRQQRIVILMVGLFVIRINETPFLKITRLDFTRFSLVLQICISCFWTFFSKKIGFWYYYYWNYVISPFYQVLK